MILFFVSNISYINDPFIIRRWVSKPVGVIIKCKLLRAAAIATVAAEGFTDGHGRRFVLDLEVTGPKGTGTVRSGWIVRTGEDFPRLTSCYLLGASS